MKKTILFAGGGTLGPVTPLLAVIDELQNSSKHYAFHWVGTKTGPERKPVATRNIPFETVVQTKIDRFFSLRNFLTPFTFLIGLIQSIRILKRVKPDLIVSAGGFVGVPIVIAGKILGIPSLIHQLDIRPGLANKICAPFARAITVTFPSSLDHYPKKKTVVTGAPVRPDILQPSTDKLPLNNDKPVLFVFGGGTGAQFINELVWAAIDELTKHFEVLHVTGQGKGKSEMHQPRYHQYPFLNKEMGEAYSKAEIVVTRAGLGTMLELAALGKPAVIIPIPNSHQEDNAAVLANAGAAVVLHQDDLSPQVFASQLIKLSNNVEAMQALSEKIKAFYRSDAAQKMVEKIEDLLYTTNS